MAVNVLVVEDDVTLRWATIQQLTRLGVEADSAANGEEALERLKRWRYQLVLMDVEMPNMNGYDATRLIREQERENGLEPIVIVGFTGLPHRQKCMEAGMSDYMQKPVMMEQMKAMLKRWQILKEEQHSERPTQS